MRLPAPITSRTNARVKVLRAALGGKAIRPGELTAVEGEHLLAEAALAGLQVETLFVREENEKALDTAWARSLQAGETLVLSKDVFCSVVDTVSPQGIAATVRIPESRPVQMQSEGAVLLLENIQDPGNLGTLIRSAAAFGAAAVLLAGECANAWSPKVLRASAGSVFHIPVQRLALAEALALTRKDRRVFAAVPGSAGAVSSLQAALQRPVLMIGNEGKGLSSEALALADERITIPCRIESFNAAVAGSVLLYESYRQAQQANA